MPKKHKSKSVEEVGYDRIRKLFRRDRKGGLIRTHTGEPPVYTRFGKRLYVKVDDNYVPAAQIVYSLYTKRAVPKGTMIYFKNNNPNDLRPTNLRAVEPPKSGLSDEFSAA